MTDKIFNIDGKKLSAARREAYLSQQQLADVLETKVGNVQRVEQGRGGFYRNKIPLIASALKLTEQQVMEMERRPHKARPPSPAPTTSAPLTAGELTDLRLMLDQWRQKQRPTAFGPDVLPGDQDETEHQPSPAKRDQA
jgi:transcriptional regulator with XRE-family HTH domain